MIRLDGNIQNMKSENFQSNFHSCCQKTQKLKLYCSKKNLKLLEKALFYPLTGALYKQRILSIFMTILLI